MKKLFLFLFSLVAVSLLVPVNSFSQANKSAQSQGLLYKISGKGLRKPSFLFGTVHVICSADMFSPEKLNTYIDRTDRVILEVNLSDPSEIAGMAKGIMMPDGKSLSDLLSPEQYSKVDELVKNALGLSVDTVKRIKPIVVQVMIAANPKVIGCSSPASYEASFAKYSRSRMKPVEGLETAALQSEVLDKIPLELQAKTLYEMALDPQKSFDQFRAVMKAYKAQDSDNLFNELSNQTESDKEIQTRLVDERNKDWIPKIEKAIREKSSFIAVGGGHLGGTQGVVNLLRSKGYRLDGIKL